MPNDTVMSQVEIHRVHAGKMDSGVERILVSHEVLRAERNAALARVAALRAFIERLRVEPFWSAHWEMEWALERGHAALEATP